MGNQTNGDDQISGPCAVCQTVTRKLCCGCRDAPVYKSSANPSGCNENNTFYCSDACQDGHWESHKSECQKLQARKKLYRVSKILQGIMFVIRRNATKVKFDGLKVEYPEDGNGKAKVTLDASKVRSDADWFLTSFPDTPADLHPDILKGVMMHHASEEALGFLKLWAKQLLSISGLCSNVEEVYVNLKEGKVLEGGTRIQDGTKIQVFIDHGEGRTRTLSPRYHLYRTTLRSSGEVWAVDPTCWELGLPHTFYPWYEVEAEDQRGWSIREAHPVGGFFPAMLNSMQLGKKEFGEKLIKNIPALGEKYGGSGRRLGGMLKGTDSAFEKVKTNFLDDVDEITRKIMAEMYPREKMPELWEKYNKLFPYDNDPEEMERVQRLFRGE